MTDAPLDLDALERSIQIQLDRTRRMQAEPLISLYPHHLRALIAAARELAAVEAALVAAGQYKLAGDDRTQAQRIAGLADDCLRLHKEKCDALDELAATRAVVVEQAATITAAAGEVEALRAELAKVKMRLRDICNALGVAEMFHDCIDPVSIEMQMHQLQQGLDLRNSAARIFQPPDDLTPDQFISWAKARGKEWKALCAELATVKAELERADTIGNNMAAESAILRKKLAAADDDARDAIDSAVALRAERDALRTALEGAGEIAETAPELNMCNYDEDQVSELNDAMIRLTLHLRAIRKALT